MKNYSRRELYALGEAFGESATRLKPGGRVYGGGGVGSAVSNMASGLGSTISAGNMNVMGNATGQPNASPTTSAVGLGAPAPTPAQAPFATVPMAPTPYRPVALGPEGYATPTAPAPAAAPFSAATPSPVTPAPTQTPMSQVESQTGITDYAKPYVETMLGATQQQLFNYDPYGNVMGLKGYTPYSYDPAAYVAGFSPLQQQAQAGVAGLQAPYQAELASGLLGGLIGQAAGTQYRPTSTGFERVGTGTFNQPSVAGSYMNPYLQQSLAPQLAAAQRASDIASQQLGAQAAQAGAFGGSRYGIQRAQAQSDLARNLANITGQGYNQAYQQAAQQYSTDAARQLAAQQANQQARQAANQLRAQQAQYGAGLGLQGLQTAMSGAGQLGGLGSTSLQNQLGVLGAQQQFGALQQQQQQQIIDQAVKNYQTAQQYPYQQLGFMQNMLGGLPLGTTSQQTYQQAPSMAQNLAALGIGAYGLGQLFSNPVAAATAGKTGTAAAGGGGSNILGNIGGVTGALNTIGNYGTKAYDWLSGLFADGGQVKGYADGGSVESPENVESIVGQLSDQQLIQAEQAAMSRGDFDQLQAVQREKAMRASERGGIAGAFNQLPAPARTQMMAGGGMVAFKDGDLVYSPEGIPLYGADTGDDLTPLERLGILNPENRRALEAMEAAEAARKAGKTEKAKEPLQPYGSSEAPVSRVTDVTPRPARSAAPAVSAPAATQGPDTVAMMNELLARQQGLQIPQQEDRETALRREIDLRQKMVGDNPAISMAQKIIDQQQAERGQALQQGRGLAALAAMRGMLQPGGFVKGLGETGSLFGEAYGKTLAQDRESAKLIQQMQINMANAQYQEKTGNFDKAEDARQKAEKNKVDLYALQTGKIKGEADIVGKISERQLKEREIAELAKYRAQQANQETAIQKIADDLQRADKSLDRKSALNEASRIAGYGFRTEAGQNKAQSAALEKLEESYKMFAALPDSAFKQQMMAEYNRRKQQIMGGAQSSPAGGGAVLRFDSKGNPIQ